MRAGFCPDGDTLAGADFGGATRLWSVTGGRLDETDVPDSHVGAAYSPAFSSDGNTLATMGSDGTARLWDTTERGDAREPAALGGEGAYLAAEFGPDGHTLATGGADRAVRLWETVPERVAAQACRRSRPLMTRAEWTRHFGDLAHRPPYA